MQTKLTFDKVLISVFEIRNSEHRRSLRREDNFFLLPWHSLNFRVEFRTFSFVFKFSFSKDFEHS